ncbi:MAG: hypothetical protein JHC93_04975, partial [Parachlamydiales bacterium]|nr:hypothetical protein [Parachlamydiales bacterium]
FYIENFLPDSDIKDSKLKELKKLLQGALTGNGVILTELKAWQKDFDSKKDELSNRWDQVAKNDTAALRIQLQHADAIDKDRANRLATLSKALQNLNIILKKPNEKLTEILFNELSQLKKKLIIKQVGNFSGDLKDLILINFSLPAHTSKIGKSNSASVLASFTVDMPNVYNLEASVDENFKENFVNREVYFDNYKGIKTTLDAQKSILKSTSKIDLDPLISIKVSDNKQKENLLSKFQTKIVDPEFDKTIESLDNKIDSKISTSSSEKEALKNAKQLLDAQSSENEHINAEAKPLKDNINKFDYEHGQIKLVPSLNELEKFEKSVEIYIRELKSYVGKKVLPQNQILIDHRINKIQSSIKSLKKHVQDEYTRIKDSGLRTETTSFSAHKKQDIYNKKVAQINKEYENAVNNLNKLMD